MHLGLGSYAFRWALGTPRFTPSHPAAVTDLVTAAADLGCTLVQLADVPELAHASDDRLTRIRSHADALGVRLQLGTSGASADRLDRYRHVAGLLGADLLRLVLHSDDTDPAMSEAERTLRGALPAYTDAGVTIGIENHFRTPSSELATLVEAVGSPTLGVTLDTANSIMSGEWPPETIGILGPYAVCLHLKDYVVQPDGEGVGGHVTGVPLGTGWLDIDRVRKVVDAADHDGRFPVILEFWLPRLPDETATLRAETQARQAAVAAAQTVLAGAGRPFPTGAQL